MTSRIDKLAREAEKRVLDGEDTQEVFERLVEEVSTFSSETLLNNKVQQLLKSCRVGGQFVSRACRDIFSVAPFSDGMSLVLFGFPCVFLAHTPLSVWRSAPRLRDELQAWLESHQLGLFTGEMRIAVAPTPLPAYVLSKNLGKSQVAWAHALMTEQVAPGTECTSLAAYEPGIWVVAACLPSAKVDVLQQHLRVPKAMDMSTRTLKNRLEALGDEAGLAFRIFPASSWANVFSLARLTAFRQFAHSVRPSTPGPGKAASFFYDGTVLAGTIGTSAIRAEFPEESPEDVTRMVESLAQSLGIEYEFNKLDAGGHGAAPQKDS